MPQYTPNVPTPGQRPSAAQPIINDNFTSLYTMVNPNAGTFIFPDQHVLRNVALNSIGIYAQTPLAPFPITGSNELFLIKSDGKHVPFTASIVNSAGTFPDGSTRYYGFYYEPSGFVVKFGTGLYDPAGSPTTNLDNTGNNIFVVTTSMPAFTNAINVQVTEAVVGLTGAFSAKVDSVNSTSLNVITYSGTTPTKGYFFYRVTGTV